MNCEELRNRVHQNLRENRSAEEGAEVAAHIEACPDCREFTAACQELTCKEFVDFLHSYLDCDLAPERTAFFDRHLALCPDCTTYIEAYRRTMDLSVSAMTQLSNTLPKIPEALVAAILDARSQGDQKG